MTSTSEKEEVTTTNPEPEGEVSTQVQVGSQEPEKEPISEAEGLSPEELNAKIENIDYKINLLISQFSKGEINEQVFQTVLIKLEKEKETYKAKL